MSVLSNLKELKISLNEILWETKDQMQNHVEQIYNFF